MEMSDCVYHLEWYMMPPKRQKIVILMIAGLQKPVYYHGAGIVILELNMFVRVSIVGFLIHMHLNQLFTIICIPISFS